MIGLVHAIGKFVADRERPNNFANDLPDYTPVTMGEARELEDMFGCMLATGHSLREATDFLLRYCAEGIE